MPKAKSRRNKTANHNPHPYTGAKTTPLPKSGVGSELTKDKISNNAPKKALNLKTLSECFEKGLLNRLEPINEEELEAIGSWRKRKRGGLKLCGAVCTLLDG